MKDEKIIDLFFARDEEALRQIENKYGSLCRYIASNFLCLREDRDECVNDVMLALWNSIPPAGSLAAEGSRAAQIVLCAARCWRCVLQGTDPTKYI